MRKLAALAAALAAVGVLSPVGSTADPTAVESASARLDAGPPTTPPPIPVVLAPPPPPRQCEAGVDNDGDG